jgi:enterochelin esterase-like enzyme
MTTHPRRRAPSLAARRGALVTALGWLLAGCGGGGGGGTPDAADNPAAGTRRSGLVASRNGHSYPVQIYLPPEDAGPRRELPVVYALDGESWFEVLASLAQSSTTPFIVVAIGNQALRNSDFVPANNCTPGGGGEAAYFRFIREELTPYVETTVGGHPARRVLFGHSHGGSFVLYALFAQDAGQHHFSAYLSSDASLGCITATAQAWEQAYAARNRARLPTRLHLSSATGGNIVANTEYGQLIEARRYAGLSLVSRSYAGSHGGIVPMVLADALPFALAPLP